MGAVVPFHKPQVNTQYVIVSRLERILGQLRLLIDEVDDPDTRSRLIDRHDSVVDKIAAYRADMG